MTMKLLTKEIEKHFASHPIYSQQGKEFEAEVLVKFFNPYGVGTWIIIEAEWDEERKDWLMYGYCSLGYGYELGYVSYNELANLKVGPFRCWSIERELYLPKGCKVKDLIKEYDLM